MAFFFKSIGKKPENQKKPNIMYLTLQAYLPRDYNWLYELYHTIWGCKSFSFFMCKPRQNGSLSHAKSLIIHIKSHHMNMKIISFHMQAHTISVPFYKHNHHRLFKPYNIIWICKSLHIFKGALRRYGSLYTSIITMGYSITEVCQD